MQALCIAFAAHTYNTQLTTHRNHLKPKVMIKVKVRVKVRVRVRVRVRVTVRVRIRAHRTHGGALSHCCQHPASLPYLHRCKRPCLWLG
jgi:hypothetical protein